MKGIRHFVPIPKNQDQTANAVMINLYYYKGGVKAYNLSISQVLLEDKYGYQTYTYSLTGVKNIRLMLVNRFNQRVFNQLKDTIEPIKEEIANLFLANDFKGIETLLKDKYYEN